MAQEIKQWLCIDLEGWDEAEDGREVQKGGGICIPMPDSLIHGPDIPDSYAILLFTA